MKIVLPANGLKNIGLETTATIAVRANFKTKPINRATAKLVILGSIKPATGKVIATIVRLVVTKVEIKPPAAIIALQVGIKTVMHKRLARRVQQGGQLVVIITLPAAKRHQEHIKRGRSLINSIIARLGSTKNKPGKSLANYVMLVHINTQWGLKLVSIVLKVITTHKRVVLRWTVVLLVLPVSFHTLLLLFANLVPRVFM